MSSRPVSTPLPARAVGALSSESDRPGTIFPAASREAATYTSDWISPGCALGVRLSIKITDVGTNGTVTIKVQVRDPATGEAIDLTAAATAALDATGSSLLTVYPGVAVTANVSVSQHIGHEFRLVATVATDDVAFSVGGVLLD